MSLHAITLFDRKTCDSRVGIMVKVENGLRSQGMASWLSCPFTVCVYVCMYMCVTADRRYQCFYARE